MVTKNACRALTVVLTLLFACVLGLAGCMASSTPSVVESAPESRSLSLKRQPQKILIVTGEYVPYTSQTLRNQGVFTEIVKTACGQAGLDIEIGFYPWGRCEEMVLSGEAWATFPYSHSEVRDKQYLFSDPIIHNRHKFYYIGGNPSLTDAALDYTEISDFAGLVFGGANGYWYGTQSDVEALGVKAEWAADTDALVKMLHAGRIDFFIEDELVCNEAIKRLYPDNTSQFATLPNNAKEQDYHLLVSRVYPRAQALLDQFNAALQYIDENGDLARIKSIDGIGQ